MRGDEDKRCDGGLFDTVSAWRESLRKKCDNSDDTDGFQKKTFVSLGTF